VIREKISSRFHASRITHSRMKFNSYRLRRHRLQGWQVAEDRHGVQEKIEAAFGQMFPSVKRIHSSSARTRRPRARHGGARRIPRAEFKMPVAASRWRSMRFLPDEHRGSRGALRKNFMPLARPASSIAITSGIIRR